ncbi:MAG: hypothetical protein DRJ01_15415 [Bacteroidetes bacterium]|nr:MAG: hypothetical protein DRJ01_15415 [Bacteroidota bacterium]
MLKFLNKPYPFNDDLRFNAKIILFISLGVLAFLLIFQPIDFAVWSKKEIVYIIAGLVTSTFLVLSLNLIVLPSLFPKIFYKNTWNIKKEILWNLWILVAISSSDFLFYSQITGLFDISFFDITKILLLGLLPVAVLITINQERLLRSHLISAQQLNKQLLEKKQHQKNLIHFVSDYKNDTLTIKADLLIAIKSSDNYIEVYYKNNEIVKKQIIRSSLKRVEELINRYEFILRCHRSYIVNIKFINEIQGNPQGFQLFMVDTNFTVPVSQKYIHEFKNKIKQV